MKNIYSLIILSIIIFGSCSSAPKRPAEVFTIQSMVETNITKANKAADQGNFTEALALLNEAWRLAVTTDRPSLRIRVSLARANCLYATGQITEAERLWVNAEQEAIAANEPMLASVTRIYRARSMLLSGKMNPADVLSLVISEHDKLKNDRLFTALNWTVRGLAEKELGRFEAAERSVKNALAIHEKDRYLEQAAYDWFLIASIRSQAGNHRASLEALRTSISFDRRAENGYGLASSWQAMGDVYQKAGRPDESLAAYRRAAEIFRAIGLFEQAENLEKLVAGR